MEPGIYMMCAGSCGQAYELEMLFCYSFKDGKVDPASCFCGNLDCSDGTPEMTDAEINAHAEKEMMEFRAEVLREKWGIKE